MVAVYFFFERTKKKPVAAIKKGIHTMESIYRI